MLCGIGDSSSGDSSHSTGVVGGEFTWEMDNSTGRGGWISGKTGGSIGAMVDTG